MTIVIGFTGSLLRDVSLGRLVLPRMSEDLQEAVGDLLSADEGGVAVARRRPRQFTLAYPIHGAQSDPGGVYGAGLRMRRQMRAMMENTSLREEGLYFAYSQDPELNGWLTLGGGQLKYVAAEGGVTMGSFSMELDSAFKRGSQRTHRDARRVEHWDRRLSTVERDLRGLVFASDFASLTPVALTFLPVNVADPVQGPFRTPVALMARAGINGTGYFAVGLPHATVVSYEQAETDMHKGDVVLWDCQGVTAPVQTLAGDASPQDPAVGYGWEEVYGPDHPLTPGGMVVLANDLTRVRFVAATTSLAVDFYQSGVGFVEQGRVTIWDSVAQDAYVRHTLVVAQNALGTVIEWSPERAVVKVTTQRAAGDQTSRVETYISLQRGWLAPRIEAYCNSPANATAGVQLTWAPNSTGGMVLAAAGSAYLVPSDDSVLSWDQFLPTFGSMGEPWVLMQPAASSATAIGVVLASIMASARLRPYVDNAAYGGANRYSVAVAARFGEAQTPGLYGYVSVHLAFTQPGALGVFEAEAYRYASATATTVADADASAGSAVNDTQTAQANTLLASTPASMSLGRYTMWVRVRVTTAGDTLTVTGGFYGPSNTGAGPVTSTSSTYTWVFLGEALLGAHSAGDLYVNAWRSAGTGTTGVRVDRMVLVPTERRQPGGAYDGARDLGASVLLDSRPIPHLLERG